MLANAPQASYSNRPTPLPPYPLPADPTRVLGLGVALVLNGTAARKLRRPGDTRAVLWGKVLVAGQLHESLAPGRNRHL